MSFFANLHSAEAGIGRMNAAKSIKSQTPPRRNIPARIVLIRRATHNKPSKSHKKTANPRHAAPGSAMLFQTSCERKNLGLP